MKRVILTVSQFIPQQLALNDDISKNTILPNLAYGEAGDYGELGCCCYAPFSRPGCSCAGSCRAEHLEDNSEDDRELTRREGSSQACSSWYSSEVKPYQQAIIQAGIQSIKCDPNYAAEDDLADGCDEDTAYKICLSATELLVGIIGTRPEFLTASQSGPPTSASLLKQTSVYRESRIRALVESENLLAQQTSQILTISKLALSQSSSSSTAALHLICLCFGENNPADVTICTAQVKKKLQGAAAGVIAEYSKNIRVWGLAQWLAFVADRWRVWKVHQYLKSEEVYNNAIERCAFD
ncbi:hypothetical protein H1R20_g10231, partial [Candolleomyces eurysporus]